MSQAARDTELPPLSHRKRPLSIIEENDDDSNDTGGQETQENETEKEKENCPGGEAPVAEVTWSPSFKAIKQFFIDKAEGHKKGNSTDEKSTVGKKVENKKKPGLDSSSLPTKVSKPKPPDTKVASSTKSNHMPSKPSLLPKTTRIAPKIQPAIKSATVAHGKQQRDSNQISTHSSRPANKPKILTSTPSSSPSPTPSSHQIKHSLSFGSADRHKTSSPQPKASRNTTVNNKSQKKPSAKNDHSSKEIKPSKVEKIQKEKVADSPEARQMENNNSSEAVGEIVSVPSVKLTPVDKSLHVVSVLETSPISGNASDTDIQYQTQDTTTVESSTEAPTSDVPKDTPSSQPNTEDEVQTESQPLENIQTKQATSSAQSLSDPTSIKLSDDANIAPQTSQILENSKDSQISSEDSQQIESNSVSNGPDGSSSIQHTSDTKSDIVTTTAQTLGSNCSLQTSSSISVPEKSSPTQRKVENDVDSQLTNGNTHTTNESHKSEGRLQISLSIALSASPPSPSIILTKSQSSLSPVVLHQSPSPKLFPKFRASPTMSRRISIERNQNASVIGKLASISPLSVNSLSPPRDIAKELSSPEDNNEFGHSLDKSRLSGRPVNPGSPLLGSKYRSPRRGSYFFKRKQSTDSLNSLSENEALETSDDVPPISAADLNRLKETAERLHLSTRRPSVLSWRQNYIDDAGLRRVAPDLNGGDATDDNLTFERKQRINDALEWLRIELQDMRTQDQALARQLLTIRQDIHQLKLQRCTEEHQNLLDDFKSELEELQEFSDVLDLPHPISEDNPLKHIGITRHNMSARRFSAC